MQSYPGHLRTHPLNDAHYEVPYPVCTAWAWMLYQLFGLCMPSGPLTEKPLVWHCRLIDLLVVFYAIHLLEQSAEFHGSWQYSW